MARYVVDTNVYIRRAVPPQMGSVDQFFESLTGEDEILAPQMLLPEFTSVLREQVALKLISAAAARIALDRTLAMPIQTEAGLDQFFRSFELAARFQHHKAYDMQFVAVAEAKGATIVTNDGGMRHAATQVGVPVRFLR